MTIETLATRALARKIVARIDSGTNWIMVSYMLAGHEAMQEIEETYYKDEKTAVGYEIGAIVESNVVLLVASAPKKDMSPEQLGTILAKHGLQCPSDKDILVWAPEGTGDAADTMFVEFLKKAF